MKSFKIIILSFFALLACNLLFAQSTFWETLQGSPGGAIKNIELSETDGKLYGFNGFGDVFRSEDDGENWELIFEQPVNANGSAWITASPNGVLYRHERVNNSLSDVFRSTDGGDTWTTVESNSDYHTRREALDGTVYALNRKEIFKSENGGSTWESLLEMEFAGKALRIDQFGHLIASYLGNRTWVSLDEGMTWDSLSDGAAFYKALFLPTGEYIREVNSPGNPNDGELVIGTLGNLNETVVTPDPDADADAFYRRYSHPLRLADGRMLVSVNGRLFSSIDNGVNWNTWADQAGVQDLLLDRPLGNGKILGDRQSSLFASTDDGLNWNPSNQGMHFTSHFKLGFSHNPETLWAINDNGVVKTNDQGANWTRVTQNSGLGFSPLGSVYEFGDGDEVFVSQDSTLFFSDDGGNTLSDITPPGETLNWQANIFYKNNSLWVNTAGGLYRSLDKGLNWELIDADLRLYNLAVHPDGRLYAITSDTLTSVFNLILSDDGGATWEDAGFTNAMQKKDLLIDTEGTIYVATSQPNGLYRSEDNGANWTAINFPGVVIRQMALNSNGHVFITTNQSSILKIYRSNNKGENWTALPLILDHVGESPNIPHSMAFDVEGYLYVTFFSFRPNFRMVKSASPLLEAAYLFGNASKSEDDDCATFDPASPLKSIIIEVQGTDTYFTNTDTLAGNYEMVLDTGSYAVTARMPLPWLWDTCTVMVDLPVFNDTTYADFSVPAKEDCPYITVDLVVPELERCFEKDIFINYCNHGTIPVDSVKLFLQLEPFLYLIDTVHNWELVPDSADLYCLNVGSLEVSDCGNIVAQILVDCDSTMIGEVHCITAYTWPNSICAQPANWSGAEINARAICTDTTVKLILENVGNAASQMLDFIVVEDDVVLLQGDDDYAPGEAITFTFPTSGTYFRIESQQESGHPFPGNVSAFTVGCNGFNSSSLNFINQYPLGDTPASLDRECRRNIGSFDPNDKQGLPLGYGGSHLIEPLTDIEYLIRFQNTGTAPAHKVVIRDTLSPFFEIGSLRVGAASHPFDWKISGNGALSFTFDNIELPDSNSNERASHGFVSFRISHRQGLPLGTDLFNSAGIYFDFNDPVITNLTHHQLGRDFLEVVGALENWDVANNVRIYPNPVRTTALIDNDKVLSFQLYDLHGRLIFTEKRQHAAGPMLLKRNGLGDGLYFISLLDGNGEVIGHGKVLFQ